MTFGLPLHTRQSIVGILAVIYGLGVAFGGYLWGDGVGDHWLTIGSYIVGILFLVLLLIPFLRGERWTRSTN